MIGNDWDDVLASVWNSNGFHNFMNIVKEKYREKNKCTKFNRKFS